MAEIISEINDRNFICPKCGEVGCVFLRHDEQFGLEYWGCPQCKVDYTAKPIVWRLTYVEDGEQHD